MFLYFYLKDPVVKKKNRSKKKWLTVYMTYYQKYKRIICTPNSTFTHELNTRSELRQLLILSASAANIKTSDIDSHNFWFYLYQQHYFSNLYKTPILLQNISALEVIPRSLLVYMVNSVKHVKWKRYNIMHSNEIVEILFLSLWLRNLKLLWNECAIISSVLI